MLGQFSHMSLETSPESPLGESLEEVELEQTLFVRVIPFGMRVCLRSNATQVHVSHKENKRQWNIPVKSFSFSAEAIFSKTDGVHWVTRVISVKNFS